MLNNIIEDKNKLLVLCGILHSKKAFNGPEVLHIDLTNWCNFNCIACWCRSPLLGDKAMPEWERKLILPLDTIKGVLDDIKEMGGLRQVKLVGGGEPFMHPDILKIIEYVKDKDKNIQIDINTNFSLVNAEIVESLLKLGVDSLTISLWAGSHKAYAAVHPNQKEETFENIKRTLELISEKKKQLKSRHPRIIIHNVIFNLNYKDVRNMLEFALGVEADDIQFVPVDVVKEKTDTLLLSDKEKKELLEDLYAIKQRFNSKSMRYVSENGKSIALPDFNGFIYRMEKFDTDSGVYDEEKVEEIPCYVGWLFVRVMATGNVVPCCKGHRMVMGNVHKNRFKDIWFSQVYNEFRYNGLKLLKSDSYFSKIGNDAVKRTGCYNCDNLWQNIPIHKKITLFKGKATFCSNLLESLIKNDK